MPTRDLSQIRLAECQRVLVVDDEETILRLLDQFFSRLGYECRTCMDGEQALAELKRRKYDLVITDMVMPFGLSGVQLVEQVRTHFPKIPVIVMTGFPIIEAITRCLKAGAADYIQKPFDFARLKNIVRSVLVERVIESDAILRNRLISGYRIMRPLREDAFAPTFLAVKPAEPEKYYDIRIFRFSMHSDRQRRRIDEDFRRNARLAAMIDSPYVLSLIDSGIEEEGAIPFLVSESFESDDLKTWCRDALPKLPGIVRLLRDIARGLAGIHAVGLVHQDLTPDSIQISRKGDLKLHPFTAARIRHADTTVHDIIHGTPAYLAPEVFLGLAQTPATDLFSLGVIGYEMIAGRRPFHATSLADYARNICEKPHEPLMAVAPSTPPKLSAIIDRLLAKDPKDRYPNAASAAVELASALRIDEPHVEPISED